MATSKASPTRIEVPRPEDDKPRIGRVAIIAVVGFALGVAWPRLAGVKLVPSAPSDGLEAVAAEDPENAASAEPEPPAPPAAKVAPAPTTEPEKPPADDRVKVSAAQITSCRNAEGARQVNCGEVEFDSVATPRLKALAQCAGTEGAEGTLSIGFDVDFPKKKIVEIMKGKSTTVSADAAKAFMDCATKGFETASLEGVKYGHARYTIFYLLEIAAPPGAKPPGEEGSTASGTATVGWEVAIIRDKPKEGSIIARILRGTRVVVTGRQGDWYRVKYDAKGSEGWVFRTAIGL